MKGTVIIKEIRKHEAFALREGNLEEYVKHTYSRKKKYFVVESNKALKFLECYRESIRVK